MNEKKRKYNGKIIAEKFYIIGDINKEEESKTKISQAYGIPLLSLSAYL
jgi:hypothetical protein